MKYRHGQWGASPAPQTHVGETPVPMVDGRFDLIVGSDVLYERDEAGTLATFIDTHAMASSQVWIVDPNRGNRAAFHRQMGRHGYRMSETRLEMPALGDLQAYRGRMLTYQRG
jgi:hypothetical protein